MCDQLRSNPSTADRRGARARLLLAMGVKDWDQLARQISEVRERVQKAFEAVVEPEQDQVAQPDQPLPEPLQKMAEDILSDTGLQRLDDTSRQRLDRFLGLIQAELVEYQNLDRLAPRLTRLILQIARRSAYLALLNETPGARTLLYRVLTASGWIADQLIQMPALLDELLDPRALFEPRVLKPLIRPWRFAWRASMI